MIPRNFLNSRIVASLTLEEVVSPGQWRAVRRGLTFDVTEPVLNMRLRDLRALVDDTDPTNDLIAYYDGWDALKHQGPSKVEVTHSIGQFFGVECLRDIDRSMLLAARQALQAGKAMAVAQAVFVACQRNIEKGRALDSINLDEIAQRVLRERTGVALLVEQVNADLAVLRSVLSEPCDIRYGPSLTIEVMPAGGDDRVCIARTQRGQTVVAYGETGVTVDVYNQEGSDIEPLSSLRLNNADLEGKMYEPL